MRFHFEFSSRIEPQQLCNQMSLKYSSLPLVIDSSCMGNGNAYAAQAFSAILVKFIVVIGFQE